MIKLAGQHTTEYSDLKYTTPAPTLSLRDGPQTRSRTQLSSNNLDQISEEPGSPRQACRARSPIMTRRHAKNLQQEIQPQRAPETKDSGAPKPASSLPQHSELHNSTPVTTLPLRDGPQTRSRTQLFSNNLDQISEELESPRQARLARSPIITRRYAKNLQPQPTKRT